MKRQNIYQTPEWFKVLQTTKQSQAAVMKLGPGQATGEEPEAHEKSDQVLLLVAGDLTAEIGGKRSPHEGRRCGDHPTTRKAQVHKQRKGASSDF